MKKILFCYKDMDFGGTEKALLSLISVIPKDDYEITFALIDNKGVLISDVPKECKIMKLPLKESDVADLSRGGAVKSVKYYFRKFRLFRAFGIAIKKIFGNSTAELKTNFKKINSLAEHYDIAVAYSMHFPFSVKYVSRKVNASNKYVFIHNDFTTTKFNISDLKNDLLNYSKIYTVSKVLKCEFDNIFPQYSSRSYVFHNIVNKDTILHKGAEFYPKDFKKDDFKIVSVGRLNAQKGFDIAIEVAKKLKDDGKQFCWYIVGGGELEVGLNQMIKKNEIENVFKLLGSKSNPYPYIKNCDLYVQPSRHEGWCLTLTEAKILAKPIIATNFAGAKEQIVNKMNGIICEANVDSLYNSIKYLIENPDKCVFLSKNLCKEKYDDNEVNLFLNS